jgi:hypothetical protein
MLSANQRQSQRHSARLLLRLQKFANKNLEISALFISTKEGSIIWSSACRKHVLGVIFNETGEGMAELHQALSQSGLGDHPGIATLIGVVELDYYDKIRRVHRTVFRVVAARDIHRSVTVERL